MPLTPTQLRARLGGVIAFPVTPFKADLSLDLPGLRRNLRKLVGQPLCAITDAGEPEAMAALDAASNAQASWAATPPRERSEILRAVYESMTSRLDELALLMTLEMGKPISESKAEVAYAADFLRWFSEEAVRINGRYSTMTGGGGRVLTMKQPVGPCVLVTPWNFPAAMATRKIGPAIAAVFHW